MLTIQDRDQRLQELYSNRELLEFVWGAKDFHDTVRKIHWDWEQSGSWIEVTDLDVEIAVIDWQARRGML